jgi:predicted amino acid-binding ACT domain protein
MVKDRPGESYRMLSLLAEQGVDLMAFNAVPLGGENTQVMLYPADSALFLSAAARAGLVPTGPQHAFLITGDDRLGACAEIHRKLAEAGINVFSSGGVTDGRGGFGYLIHVRPEDYERAARVLES